MSLGEMKKGALLEFFTEVARANLDRDQERLERARTSGLAKGLSEADFEWVCTLDGKDFKKIFGENAINEDLQSRMRDYDAVLEAAHYSPIFKGHYPAR